MSGQLGALTRCKKNITHTPKEAKTRIIRSLATETLNWDPTLKSRRRLNIHQESGSRNSLSPEVWWDSRSKHKSTGCLKKMTMLPFSQTVLGMSTRARKLRECALLSMKTTKDS